MERHQQIPSSDPPPPEARDETVERVLGDSPDADAVVADPTTRRRLGSTMWGATIGVALAVAAIVIGVLVLIGAGTGLALALGGAAALGSGIMAALVIAEREDGRVEHDVADDAEPRAGSRRNR